MTQFKAINNDVEVNGQTVLSVIDGMGAMKQKGIDILSENGITNPVAGAWYSQQDWLNAFRLISEKIGPNTLFVIGSKIPENAEFPPEIDNIEKALSAIDVAYHMNHRLHGQTMFDPKNGVMTEGIGHYAYKKTGDNQAEITCDNPYPCDFDRGIIEAMAKRFKPKETLIVKVDHEEKTICRKDGSDNCKYTISW